MPKKRPIRKIRPFKFNTKTIPTNTPTFNNTDKSKRAKKTLNETPIKQTKNNYLTIAEKNASTVSKKATGKVNKFIRKAKTPLKKHKAIIQ
jgi:hypothetical protein